MLYQGMATRIVVTGMGVVSPLGLNTADTWEGLVNGRSSIGPVTEFDTTGFCHRLSASVHGFDPTRFMDAKEARRMARHTQFAVAALAEAQRQAGIDFTQEDPTRVGVSIGSALGGIPLIEEQINVLNTRGPKRVNPTALPAVLVNMSACHMAVSIGAKGPALAPVAACATGIAAIGDAVRLMQHGDIDVMVAGGTESSVTPIGFATFGRLGALSSRNDDPANACQPFDLERDGTIVGEGAAVFILETEEHARRRGAVALAEIAGYGFTEDAYHLVMPDPSGEGGARAMRMAIEDAGWTPRSLDYICAHGTGTPLNDVSETKAIKLALGDEAHRVPISSNKSMVGHMLGAAGAFSTAVAIKTILEGTITPTSNLHNPDPECDLDYVPLESRTASVRRTLVNAFGFGGQNLTLAVGVYE